MMWGWAPWWHWAGMALGWAVLLGAALAAALWLFPREPRSSAQDILDARLARGEIDLDEYRRLREQLVRG